MKYSNITRGEFISRLNRFIANVMIDGAPETVHVKNTGRCKELLVPGATVYLTASDNPARRTKYDLIAVEKRRDGKSSLLINMDSQVVNDATAEWLQISGLFPRNAVIRREVFYGDSRFDFAVTDGDKRAFVEVKGVTLEHDGIASFPDAPTERGIKHLHELIRAKTDGYDCYVLFVIQMKEITEFRPNDATHAAFGDALREARDCGVGIIAMDCIITPDSITIDTPVKMNI